MQDTNPYQPPRAQLLDAADDVIIPVPAARWRRFLTYIIDYIAVYTFAFGLGIIVALVFGQEGIQRLQTIPDILLGLMLMLIYYIPQEAVFGRTLGKLVLGTKVVNANGGRASVGQVIGRTFSRFIPFEAFSFFFYEGRGWHDRIAGTFVVSSR